MSSDTPHVCVAAIGSMTLCIKAQRALLDNGIAAHVIALSPRETRNGCAYGVAFSPAAERSARAALGHARVPVSQYLTKDSGTP